MKYGSENRASFSDYSVFFRYESPTPTTIFIFSRL